MDEEIIACINEKNLKYLHSGQISKYIFPMNRKEAHEKKQCHLIIRMFIMSITPDNEILYLVQKRSKKKRVYPEYFTDSASGHVVYQENLEFNDITENALRELEEEFGIPPKEVQKLIFYDLRIEEDDFTGEIAYIYYGLVNYNVELRPDPLELDAEKSHFYSKSELEDLFKEPNIIDYSKQIWNEILNLDILKLFDDEEKGKKITNTDEKTALFIGRFQPLHHGHVHVIKNILEAYKKIIIGIGSSQLSNTRNDPFTSEERIRFIEALMEKLGIENIRFEIVKIPDIFDAKKWVDYVVSLVGKFDTVYSNNSWIRNLFSNRNFNIGEKLELSKEKYNASNIRNMINNDNYNWTSLVPKEVEVLLLQFNGIKRIKTLFNQGDN